MRKNSYKIEKNYEEDYIHLNESSTFYRINFSNWCWRCRDYFLGSCIFMKFGFIRRDVCKECRNDVINRNKIQN